MKIEEKYKLEKYIKEDGSEVNVYFDIDRHSSCIFAGACYFFIHYCYF